MFMTRSLTNHNQPSGIKPGLNLSTRREESTHTRTDFLLPGFVLWPIKENMDITANLGMALLLCVGDSKRGAGFSIGVFGIAKIP